MMLRAATTRALHAARALSAAPARAAQPKKKLLGPKKNAQQVRELLRARLALTDAELDRMVRRRPLGALATIKPKLDWLQRRLDLDQAQLARLVRREPTVLTNSVERNNAPTLDWLQTRLELDTAQLGRMVVKLPALIGKRPESMEANCDWLRRRLGLDATQTRRLVAGFPPLLYLSVDENLKPTLDWLQKRLDLDDGGLRKMVLTHPPLLGLSVEANMAPKLAYLEQELNMTRAALRDHVLRIPAILAYSLDKRYRPRVEACRAAGVDAAYVLTAAPLTDEYFYERLETMREETVATASSRARSQIAPRRRAFSTAARATTLPGRRAVSTASSDDGTGLPGTEHGGRRLAIVFTCTVCDTRSAKKFSEQAYREGVVVVRCPGCGNDHLIADNLGFFEDDWTLEDALRARGDAVETLDDDNLAEGVDADLLKRLVEGRRDK